MKKESKAVQMGKGSAGGKMTTMMEPHRKDGTKTESCGTKANKESIKKEGLR
ncbi:MAG TPA: hypothetical protein VLN47_07775 [Clostridiaceae bacterium]|nr:hypothetical protein [Clostridiaceae bacterium]